MHAVLCFCWAQRHHLMRVGREATTFPATVPYGVASVCVCMSPDLYPRTQRSGSLHFRKREATLGTAFCYCFFESLGLVFRLHTPWCDRRSRSTIDATWRQLYPRNKCSGRSAAVAHQSETVAAQQQQQHLSSCRAPVTR